MGCQNIQGRVARIRLICLVSNMLWRVNQKQFSDSIKLLHCKNLNFNSYKLAVYTGGKKKQYVCNQLWKT